MALLVGPAATLTQGCRDASKCCRRLLFTPFMHALPTSLAYSLYHLLSPLPCAAFSISSPPLSASRRRRACTGAVSAQQGSLAHRAGAADSAARNSLLAEQRMPHTAQQLRSSRPTGAASICTSSQAYMTVPHQLARLQATEGQMPRTVSRAAHMEGVCRRWTGTETGLGRRRSCSSRGQGREQGPGWAGCCTGDTLMSLETRKCTGSCALRHMQPQQEALPRLQQPR